MIGLILGTSEGKNILSELNKYTDDIFVTTATNYGGELLENYRYKVLNTKPLGLDELKNTLIKNNVELLVDASHPYAVQITDNAIKVCKELNIKYLRYERGSVLENFKDKDKIKVVNSFEELGRELKNIEGNVLNTTGSRNLDKLIELKLKNRIIHRILPTVESIEKTISLGIKVDDIVAIKGPIGYELNCSFIKEYDAKAMILKDSGVQGGTEEKLRAALDMDIYAFVLKRADRSFEYVFNDEIQLVNYIIKNKYK